MKASFYILFSPSLNKYHLGHPTEDINERLRKHLSNHDGFTSRAKGWRVVYIESYNSKEEAYKRERQVKRWRNRRRIEELIRSHQSLSSAGSEHPDF